MSDLLAGLIVIIKFSYSTWFHHADKSYYELLDILNELMDFYKRVNLLIYDDIGYIVKLYITDMFCMQAFGVNVVQYSLH